MKPYYSLSASETINIPYNIKISNKYNAIDQKREEIELKPGHHLILRHTVILPDRTLKKWGLSTFAF